MKNKEQDIQINYRDSKELPILILVVVGFFSKVSQTAVY